MTPPSVEYGQLSPLLIVLGVAVACVPILLAVGGPLLEGHGPAPRVLAAAIVVTAAAGALEGVAPSESQRGEV